MNPVGYGHSMLAYQKYTVHYCTLTLLISTVRKSVPVCFSHCHVMTSMTITSHCQIVKTV